MKGIFLIFLLLIPMLVGGCGSTRAALSHDVAVRDSTCERVRIETRTELVPVVVTMAVPEIREVRRDVRDTVDTIENDYAVSTVAIHRDGTFDHSLETKPHEEKVTADVPVRATDTVVEKERVLSSEEKTVVTETVEVNVLRWWQKCLMWCGAVGIACAVIRISKIFL